MSPYVHSSAVIDEDVEIGDGARIWHFVHVSRGARIGEGAVLGQNVFVGPGVEIGRGAKVQNNVSIYVGVTLEEDVFLGPSCVFTNVINPRAFIERKTEFRATRVGKGATIGANATIVCGNDIGAYAMVGAGAVVTHEVAPFALVVGVPARRVGFVCVCGETLPEGANVTCPLCDTSYQIDGDICMQASGTSAT